MKQLPLDRALKAPVCEDEKLYSVFRTELGTFLAMHEISDLVQTGSSILSFPATIDVSLRSTSGMMPMVLRGTPRGPQTTDDCIVEHHRCLFAYVVLTTAFKKCPLVLSLINAVPSPNAHEAFKQIEKALLPQIDVERMQRQNELMFFKQ